MGARKIRIGVMGAQGSFSEEAGRTYAKKAGLKAFELDYLVSAENVLSQAIMDLQMQMFSLLKSK